VINICFIVTSFIHRLEYGDKSTLNSKESTLKLKRREIERNRNNYIFFGNDLIFMLQLSLVNRSKADSAWMRRLESDHRELAILIFRGGINEETR